MLTRNVCRKCERYFPNITGGSCPICNGMLRDLNLSPWESYACDNRSPLPGCKHCYCLHFPECYRPVCASDYPAGVVPGFWQTCPYYPLPPPPVSPALLPAP